MTSGAQTLALPALAGDLERFLSLAVPFSHRAPNPMRRLAAFGQPARETFSFNVPAASGSDPPAWMKYVRPWTTVTFNEDVIVPPCASSLQPSCVRFVDPSAA